MTDEKKRRVVENYVRAYNNFDVEGMLSGLHEEVVFKNFSNGELTLELAGIKALRDQAEQAAGFFSEREQKIKDFVFTASGCEIDVDYRATLAADLPNGLRAGDRVELEGKSVFRFAADGRVIEIQDFS